jgi:hypothetical protein
MAPPLSGKGKNQETIINRFLSWTDFRITQRTARAEESLCLSVGAPPHSACATTSTANKKREREGIRIHIVLPEPIDDNLTNNKAYLTSNIQIIYIQSCVLSFCGDTAHAGGRGSPRGRSTAPPEEPADREVPSILDLTLANGLEALFATEGLSAASLRCHKHVYFP